MKTEIHPTYHSKSKVACACGAKFDFGSTSDGYTVDVCSKCHPFYTGKQKLVDRAGRVDKFRARTEKAKKIQEEISKRESVKPKNESVEEKMTRKARETAKLKAAEKAKEQAKKGVKKSVDTKSRQAKKETKK